MAIYTLPAMTNRIAGSRGGSTFQKAGTNYTIRKHNSPVQKRTARQSTSKCRLGSTAQRWRQLSSGNKSTWTTEAANYPRNDSLGNPYNFTGQNMQVGSNANLLNSAASPITTPASGSTPALPNVNTALVIVSSTFAKFPFNPVTIPAGFAYKLFIWKASSIASPLQSLEDYKLAYIYQPAEDSNTTNQYTLLLSMLPNLTDFIGGWVYYAWQAIELATGQQSNSGFGFAVIQA